MINTYSTNDYFLYHQDLKGFHVIKDGIRQNKTALFHSLSYHQRRQLMSNTHPIYKLQEKDGWREGNYIHQEPAIEENVVVRIEINNN